MKPKRVYTAHCLEFGYVYIEVEGERKVLAGMYNEAPVPVEEEVAVRFLCDAEEEVDYEAKKLEETLVNSNFVGRTTNFNELGQANVGYTVGEPAKKEEEEEEEDDSDLMPEIFTTETISWWGKTGETEVILNGEMKGFREVGKNSANQNIEPLTVREAAEFIDVVCKTTFSEESDEVLIRSTESCLFPELEKLLTRIENYEEAMFEHSWNLGKYITNADGTMSKPETTYVDKWAGLRGMFNPKDEVSGECAMSDVEETKFIDYMVSRLKITVRDNSLSGQWAWQDRYSMGERKGVADITKELSVQNRTKQQQYNDDDIILLEKAAWDKSLPSMYSQMYDAEGKNKGFGDRSRYYWRCATDRERRFITLQMYITRVPIEVLKNHYTGKDSALKVKYRKSVQECAPGPSSTYSDGKWVSGPLAGEDAVAELVARGFDKDSLSPDVRFHRGESWHKVWLKREHVDALQAMIEKRISKETVTFAKKFSTVEKKENAISILKGLVTRYNEQAERATKSD